MGLFSTRYEPGGTHHVKITDKSFEEALSIVSADDSFVEQATKIAKDNDVFQYQAKDFPVSKIIAIFYSAYQLQQEKLRIPEELWLGRIELGRKEMIEYQKFTQSFIEKHESKSQRQQEAWDQKGLGGKLFSVAVRAAARGVANVATGKGGDVRGFENNFANYLCGDSPMAKKYLMGFANEFGGNDEGLINVAEVLRQSYWVNEFARSVRR